LGYGLAGMVVLSGWLDSMILEVFSYDSMILWFISQASSKAACTAGRGRWFCPSITPVRPHLESCVQLSTRRTWTSWSRSREGHRNGLRAEAPLLWGEAERIVQPGEEKAVGRPYCGFSALNGGLWERWGQTL